MVIVFSKSKVKRPALTFEIKRVLGNLRCMNLVCRGGMERKNRGDSESEAKKVVWGRN